MKFALIAALISSNLAFAAGPGQRLYNAKCASCHGKDGRGQTEMGRKTQVKDLTDPNVQATFSGDTLIDELTNGMKDTKMPGYKDKLSGDEIQAVAAYTRALGK
jgi:mono/diheme cytochrome c family protein